MTQSTPVFIVGAQRSGTTLLRLPLNAHSALAIPEEGTFWMPLLRRFGRRGERELRGRDLERALAYIERNHQFKLWNTDPSPHFDALRRAGHAQLDELIAGTYPSMHERRASRCGARSPRSSSARYRFSPICFRAPASFISSATAATRSQAGARWIRRRATPRWRRSSGRTSCARRAETWPASGRNAASSCATSARRGSGNHAPHRMPFPGSRVRAPDARLLAIEPRAHRRPPSHMIFNPVSTRSVSRWQKDPTPRQARNFELLAGCELRALGYDVARPSGNGGRSSSAPCPSWRSDCRSGRGKCSPPRSTSTSLRASAAPRGLPEAAMRRSQPRSSSSPRRALAGADFVSILKVISSMSNLVLFTAACSSIGSSPSPLTPAFTARAATLPLRPRRPRAGGPGAHRDRRRQPAHRLPRLQGLPERAGSPAPGERQVWPLPFTLAVTGEQRAAARGRARGGARRRDGRLWGVIRSPRSTAAIRCEARSVYRTEIRDPPRGGLPEVAPDASWSAGDVQVLPLPDDLPFPSTGSRRAAARRDRRPGWKSRRLPDPQPDPSRARAPHQAGARVHRRPRHPSAGRRDQERRRAGRGSLPRPTSAGRHATTRRTAPSWPRSPPRCATPARARRSSTRWPARTTASTS